MHKNPKTAHKNAQKRFENFKSCIIHNFVSTGISCDGFVHVLVALLGVQGIVSGKMYNRHLFPYGG